MKPDDEICYCFHVTLRKLVNYARRTQPRKPSQMSQCLDAGTGCGWCIPILRKIHAEASACAAADDNATLPDLPETADQYADGRRRYLDSGEKNRF